MPIRGDRLRWPPRPGKRSGAAASAARRLASPSELSGDVKQHPLSTDDCGPSANTVASPARDAAHPADGAATGNRYDEKLIRDD